MEICRPRPDKVLGMISDFISEDNDFWEGTASELMEAIPGLKNEIKPNALERKLNTNVSRLYREAHILYEPMKRQADRKPFSLKYIGNEI